MVSEKYCDELLLQSKHFFFIKNNFRIQDFQELFIYSQFLVPTHTRKIATIDH
jgi:hypothetical protein